LLARVCNACSVLSGTTLLVGFNHSFFRKTNNQQGITTLLDQRYFALDRSISAAGQLFVGISQVNDAQYQVFLLQLE
jgi:hypothetical protein